MRIPSLVPLLFISLAIHYAYANKISSLQLYAYYNAQQHNTRAYEVVKPDSSSDLVLRRGANAFLAVRLAEQYNPQKSKLYLRIMFGKLNLPNFLSLV